MEPLIGILLNRHILQNAVRGKPVFERLDLYAEAALEIGVTPVFFDLGGIRFADREVVGYARSADGTFHKLRTPLPGVIHKRALYRRAEDRSRVRRLEALGIDLFNPEVSWDKFRIERLLRKEPELAPYLPESELPRRENFEWFRSHLAEGGEVFVKPRKGSLGLGVARVARLGSRRYCYQSAKLKRTTSLRGAWALVRKERHRRFMQVGIPLVELDGRRIDLRVPVQRDGEGRWQIPGIVARRAGKLSYLTNMARGGSAYNGRDAIAHIFGGERAPAIIEEIERLSLLVAETLRREMPALADLGLDVGVAVDGRPYLIEVNRRDLRYTLRESGQDEAYRAVYKNPLAFALYLHRMRRESGAWAPELALSTPASP